MNRETKQCQNCKNQFVIEAEDFAFYEKIKAPPPTFCSECRFQRRLMFRNEWSLYWRTCDLCGERMLAVFSPDKPYRIYCSPCWWSDKWSAADYAMNYDPNRNFFEQFRELTQKVPYMNLINSYSQLVNSEYVNHTGELKNCYLVFNANYCENVLYTNNATGGTDSMDCTMFGESELCYADINCGKCSRVFFSEDCTSCLDVYFSKELIGCNNCFGCINMRNKKYHIFNQPYTKDEYKKKIDEFKLDSFLSVENLKGEVLKFWQKFPHKYMHKLHNVNVSGDYVYQAKNAYLMYQVRFVEDGKWCQFITQGPAKDLYDYTEWGNGAQRIYECITVGEGVDNMKFCSGCWFPSQSVEYSMFTLTSSYMFGCVGLRKKQYCILNKEYSKDEYDKLREKIIEDMNANPYIDTKGRVFKYGEFFPYDLSLFDYNETTTMDYFPLSKEEILSKGWRYREPTPTEYKITLTSENIPDSINDVSDTILNEILECSECKRAFRIVRAELDLLQRFGFPVPRKCSNCRYRERLNRINPPRLWERKCAKCSADIKTSYSPERPEIVYCEQCYNAEVV